MSLQSYQAAQRATENPRSTEYRLFALVTRTLMNSKDQPLPRLFEALDWNRRMWLTLQGDLANENNRLPDQLKGRLISLAIWVDKHTSKVIHGVAKVDPLIEVNRNIMEGLMASAAAGAGSRDRPAA